MDVRATLAKVRIAAAALAAAAAMTGCGEDEPGPAPAPTTETAERERVGKSVGQDANGKSVTLAPGEALTVTLSENPSTGYEWRPLKQPAPQVLESGPSRYEPAVSGEDAPIGSGGVRVFEFTAAGAGSTSVVLGHFPPDGDSPVSRFRLDVTIR